MKELFDGISQVGFPIVVSVLLLIRVESKVADMTKTIDDLKETIVKLTTIIEERLGRRK